MPLSSSSNWSRVKREATANARVTQDPESPYDPNDAVAVDAFWGRAFISRQDEISAQGPPVARQSSTASRNAWYSSPSVWPS